MDVWKSLMDHYDEALQRFPELQVVCLVLQGSQNYGLDTANSDVDTKLLVTPTLRELAVNAAPVSYTHVRENNEHTDWKDVRLYINLFKHQNPNFMEALFTPWSIVNPVYKSQWNRLIEAREDVAHMNIYRAAHAMCGMMQQKYHAMEHPYPSKLALIKRYGYDGKQLSHLVRLEEFMERYLAGESYESCLTPRNKKYLVELKENKMTLEEGRELAAAALKQASALLDGVDKNFRDVNNRETEALLEDVQYHLLRTSLEEELK